MSSRITAAHIAIIGLGGLGCPAAAALVRCGIGKLTLVDPDTVELSNLPRQHLHTEADLGRTKVQSAADSLAELASETSIATIDTALTRENAAKLFKLTDFVIDATDGVSTKLLINDISIATGTPYCYAGVVGFCGQTMVVTPDTACLRCLFPDFADAEEAASCEEAGIIGPVAGLFGAMQAVLALEYLTNQRRNVGRLVSYDGLTERWSNISVPISASCRGCSDAAGQGPRPKERTGAWTT